MPLQFDIHGCLIPYQEIPTNSWEMFEHFVEAFPKSETRAALYDILTNYCTQLKNILYPDITEISKDTILWIDGSFVTKKENPNDIDIVIFVDSQLFGSKKELLVGLKCNKSQQILPDFPRIDAHIVEKYPPSHAKYNNYHLDYLYWLDWFSKNRKGRKKGILSLSLCDFDRIHPNVPLPDIIID